MKNFSLPRPVTDDEISGMVCRPCTLHPPANMYANSDFCLKKSSVEWAKLVEELRDDFEYINLLPHGE